MIQLKEAFKRLPRSAFLPDEVKHLADFDAPLPIGYNQTNSQPYTVSKMLEWLAPKTGDKVLDVGSGSGWTTALLAHLVGNNGRVIAVERVPELVEIGHRNCKKFNIKNATFHQATNKLGWPKEAPYERILVSASADKLPTELFEQLAAGGKLIVPVRGSILEISKDTKNKISTKEHFGFDFVPLLTD